MHAVIANLTNGGLSGGARKYLREMCPLLENDPAVTRLDVFVPPGCDALLQVKADFPYRAWPENDHRQGFAWLRRHLSDLRPDVVFIPSARWIGLPDIPIVTMLRNMEPLTVPFGGNSLPEGIKNLARTQVARRACQRASRVIAVSQFVSDYLVNRWRINTRKVGLIYHGANRTLQPYEMTCPARLANDCSQPFIFTAGSIRAARGLEDLVQALVRLKTAQSPARLVIAGATNPGTELYQRRIIQTAKRLGVDNCIQWIGELNDKQMAWCYAHCELFVMTSRAEACPNTAIEAMQYGCPIVSTDTQPMPEFFQDVANYYPGGNSVRLAQQMRRALTASTEDARRRRQLAILRSAHFNWYETAHKTVQQLVLAAKGKELGRTNRPQSVTTDRNNIRREAA